MERVPALVAPCARRTGRLQESLLRHGFDLGGALGARHCTAEGMPVSARTLIRMVRAAPTPAAGQVRVLGVDDRCRRKGRTYSTAHRVAHSTLEFTVVVPRAPLRERYGSAWKRAAVPRRVEDDGTACAGRTP